MNLTCAIPTNFLLCLWICVVCLIVYLFVYLALQVETMESLLAITSLALQQSSMFYLNPPKNANHAGLVRDSDEGAVQGSGAASDASHNGQERLMGTRGTANGMDMREKDFTGAQHASKYSVSLVRSSLQFSAVHQG